MLHEHINQLGPRSIFELAKTPLDAPKRYIDATAELLANTPQQTQDYTDLVSARAQV
jgi:hypothetical protein